ncbi:hypothetical protein DAPPUDRAFT_257513 [Daphnia pulex]|uniref:Uncharacterized protein n=1 Tax=Daphnia pulex TaxID=6669 RepID=E9HDQ8_DAPPU|nr:hypothetical protein DAPPUDRAFT_257513 [Daphnia pulex]|eukprot:EFX70130.1 hypothetical protein DAPPUDRAFT_257513 [Daphnia pulex]
MAQTERCEEMPMKFADGKWLYVPEPSESGAWMRSTSTQELNCMVEETIILQEENDSIDTPLGRANISDGVYTHNHMTLIWDVADADDNFSDADSKIDVGGVDDTDDNNSVHYMMMEEEDGCCEANGSGVDSDGERDDHLHGHHGHHHGHHHHHNNNNNNNNGSKGKGCSSSSSATDAGGGQHQQLHNSSSGSGHSAGSNSKRKKKTRTVFSRQSGLPVRLSSSERAGLAASLSLTETQMSTPTTNSYITIAIGGWSEGSGKYSDMAETLANRKAFIDSVLIFIKRINVYVMIKYSPLQIQKHKDVKEKPTYMKQYFYD